MKLVESINNKNLVPQLNTITRANVQGRAAHIMPLVLQFVATQANEHANYSPMATVNNALGKIYKPKELKALTSKNFIAYAASIGIAYNKKTKTFSKANKKKAPSTFDADFYKSIVPTAKVEKTSTKEKPTTKESETVSETVPVATSSTIQDQVRTLATQAKDAKISHDEMLQIISEVYKVELTLIDEVA
tara:strand:- start:23 stop:592 length:570 start_codon:yes stop_codon:yes gene_type:complete